MPAAHVPTDDQRKAVKSYALNGVNHDRIARAIGISDETLRKHYRAELDEAAGRWEADFEHVLGRDVLRPDCPPAIKIFMAKVRLGYRELVARDPDKKPLEDMTNDELRAIVAERARSEREARDREAGESRRDSAAA